MKWVGGVAAILAVLGGLGITVFGSVEAAVARLRGDSLGASPAVLAFGTGRHGDTLTATVTVRNWTGRPIRLYSGTSDCTCLQHSTCPYSSNLEDGQTFP